MVNPPRRASESPFLAARRTLTALQVGQVMLDVVRPIGYQIAVNSIECVGLEQLRVYS